MSAIDMEKHWRNRGIRIFKLFIIVRIVVVLMRRWRWMCWWVLWLWPWMFLSDWFISISRRGLFIGFLNGQTSLIFTFLNFIND
jgi:hypothetical protein